ncbi:MAG: type I-C CRISPR-associated protein Cas8c/Csd1 [Acidobacteria bacterium]|nr:type I-C CRISPR-associated protein Cas8c/Csd1 [Acidobacteriota bacterium]
MLLASLVRFAERKRLVDDIAFEQKAVDFLVHINERGQFLGLVDRREKKGKKLVGAVMEIPRLPKRTSGVSASLLVDNAKYVLGVGDDRKGSDRLAQCAEAFRKRVEELSEAVEGDAGIEGTLAFLCDTQARQAAARSQATWTGSELLGFQLVTDTEPVHQRPLVRATMVSGSRSLSKGRVRCLVTGRRGPTARLHPVLKRVPNGQSSGTSLVSFNGDAFASHGLTQGDNAPISKEAAVAYSTALNFMLAGTDTRPHRSGIRLGQGAVLLAWTDADSPFADELVATLDPPFVSKDEDAAKPKKRRSVVGASLAEGKVELIVEAPWKRLTAPAADDDTVGLFGVILSGNAARAVVRGSFNTSVADAKANVRHWFRALSLKRGSTEESPTIPRILKSLDPPGNAELPPSISSRLTMSALWGRALPADLLRHALLRFRRDDKEYLAFSRAAIIKACLVNLSPPRLKETDVSLDALNIDQAYLLGRLFATLEKAQENALPGLNATIRDRYFTAASTSPGTVFPRLLRLTQHHVSKAKAENRGFGIERRIQDIVSALPAKRFPALFSLADQGMFAIGYYHQRDAFFTKKDATKEAV